MSRPDAVAATALQSVPRDAGGPVFPAPWAARAYALAVALNDRSVFAWSEWSQILGAKVSGDALGDAANPESYWRAWLAALEDMLATKRLAEGYELAALQQAWREAAAATPHGEPVELSTRRHHVPSSTDLRWGASLLDVGDLDGCRRDDHREQHR